MTQPTDGLISVGEAHRRIRAEIHILDTEKVATAHALGRVLRQPIKATRDQPPFDRATMDGVALSSTDTSEKLSVSHTVPAGKASTVWQGPGTCVAIMTGAVVPEGCDVVVPVEQINRHGSDVHIHAEAGRAAGTYIHKRASDHSNGTTLLQPGVRIDAPTLAVIVSTGLAELEVTRSPRISVVASGDELVDLGAVIEDYQVRRSNDYAAAALLAQHGWTEARRDHIEDNLQSIRSGLERALRDDVVVLSGGVSKGAYDFLPDALAEVGVRKVFHRVAQRPGKPMWFGVGPEGQLVFALPGNPVSALTCLRRYVIDALRWQSGQSNEIKGNDHALFAVLDEAVMFRPPLAWLAAARCVADDGGQRRVKVQPVNTSGDYTALAGTDGLVELPADRTTFERGEAVQWFPW